MVRRNAGDTLLEAGWRQILAGEHNDQWHRDELEVAGEYLKTINNSSRSKKLVEREEEDWRGEGPSVLVHH